MCVYYNCWRLKNINEEKTTLKTSFLLIHIIKLNRVKENHWNRKILNEKKIISQKDDCVPIQI